MKQVRALCIQTGPGGAGAEYVRGVLKSQEYVDLVVLPELSHLPYFPVEWPSIYIHDSLTMSSEVTREFQTIAAEFKCHIVFPLYFAEGVAKYNSAILIGPDGNVMEGEDLNEKGKNRYDKVHLINIKTSKGNFYESKFFRPGEGPVVWNTAIGKIGILICYDRHFPEAWRTLRVMGTEIVCVPVASPLLSEEWFVAEIQTMAMQQSIYAIAVNRAGSEQLKASGLTTEYVGLSCIVAPNGRILGQADKGKAATTVAVLDLEVVSKIRKEFTYLEDRRPNTYKLS